MVILLASLVSYIVNNLVSLGGLAEGFSNRTSELDSKVVDVVFGRDSKAFYECIIIISSLLY